MACDTKARCRGRFTKQHGCFCGMSSMTGTAETRIEHIVVMNVDNRWENLNITAGGCQSTDSLFAPDLIYDIRVIWHIIIRPS